MAELKVKKVNKTVKAAPKVKVEAVKKVAEKSMSLPVVGLKGEKKGTIAVSKEVFGAKVNEKLMAQAVRVYLVNQRQGTVSTKTRGEVKGSTRKIYRQKGTGRARHGSIKAPIFVGGGIAFGPRPRTFELSMPTQMRRKALFSALSSKFADQKITVLDIAGLIGKTKEINNLLIALSFLNKKKDADKVLFVLGKDEKTKQAVRNVEGLEALPASSINTYMVLNSKNIIFAKDALEIINETFFKGEAKK